MGRRSGSVRAGALTALMKKGKPSEDSGGFSFMKLSSGPISRRLPVVKLFADSWKLLEEFLVGIRAICILVSFVFILFWGGMESPSP